LTSARRQHNKDSTFYLTTNLVQTKIIMGSMQSGAQLLTHNWGSAFDP
jgi:hypothetical protein